MIPSNTWFPTNLAARAAWFQNFATNFEILGTVLGFAPAVITQVTTDNLTMQFLASSALQVDAFAKAMSAYRKEVTEGVVGSPAAYLPPVPDFTSAPVAVTGIFERLDDLVKRIRVAPSYSAEEGEALGIIPSSSGGKTPLNEEKPVLKAKALPGNVIEVAFVRGQSSGITMEMKLDNEPDWKSAGFAIKSPTTIEVPAGTGNLPRAVQIRARFLDNNTAVGFLSDTVNIVSTP